MFKHVMFSGVFVFRVTTEDKAANSTPQRQAVTGPGIKIQLPGQHVFLLVIEMNMISAGSVELVFGRTFLPFELYLRPCSWVR